MKIGGSSGCTACHSENTVFLFNSAKKIVGMRCSDCGKEEIWKPELLEAEG